MLQHTVCYQARAADLQSAKHTLWHWATETIKDCCQLFWYLISIWNDRWCHKICLWKDGLASAKGHYISKSREKKLKINFLRIWSLDFSSYTSYDSLIAKERTPHNQKCARILIDSKSIPDSVCSCHGSIFICFKKVCYSLTLHSK